MLHFEMWQKYISQSVCALCVCGYLLSLGLLFSSEWREQIKTVLYLSFISNSQFIRSFVFDRIASYKRLSYFISNHLLLLYCWFVQLFVNVSMKTLLRSLCFFFFFFLSFSRFSLLFLLLERNGSNTPFNWNLDKEQRKRKLIPWLFFCVCMCSIVAVFLWWLVRLVVFCAHTSNDNSLVRSPNWKCLCMVELRHFRKLSLISDGPLLFLSLSFFLSLV